MVLLASKYDQSRFFKTEELATEKKLKIKDVTEQEVGIGKDKEWRLVVWFTNDLRGLVLNKTNNRTLRGAFGDDTAEWRGKIIILFPTQVEYRGQMKPGIRVRIPPPKENGHGVMQPVGPPPASTPVEVHPAEIDVDDDLNDEINI